MKIIPAIRAQIGIWGYYVSTLSFQDINDYVKPIDDELHKSELLRTMIQRSITENYISIANYIENQNERFFNALILAVYDGQPVWNGLRLKEIDEEEYSFGFLSLTGEEKIFPVDGQHRVAGIKKALERNPELAKEQVPVVFIGHSKDDEGMKRTRRMFSTLNRYAKPVSMRDIIALDEDDVVAIASRNIIDNTNLFGKNGILDSKTKAIPDGNKTALTSIISYYECNMNLLWLKIKDVPVYGDDDELIKSRNSKISQFIKRRPENEFINNFSNECLEYWKAILDACNGVSFEEDKNVEKYRNNDGGHLFFRPAGIIPFTQAIVRIVENKNCSYAEAIAMVPAELFWIQHDIWKRILWNSTAKTMINGKGKLVELLLVYYSDKSLLKASEIKKIVKDCNGIWEENLAEEEVLYKLDQMVGERY